MGKLVVLALTAVALAILSVQPVSAAQPYDPPTGLSGWVHGLPDDEEACIGTVARSGPIEEVRGFRCELWMGMTDPRLTGRYVVTSNSDTYHSVAGDLEDGVLTVSRVRRRVENDDGAWVAAPTVTAFWVADADDEDTVTQTWPTIPTESITFYGEGGYEGLTAIVWLNSYIVGPRVWGVILEGDPRPPPSS